MDRKTAHFVKHYLLVVGGVVLGATAIFGTNPIHEIFISFPTIEKLIYLFIAAAAILDLVTHKVNCAICAHKKR